MESSHRYLGSVPPLKDGKILKPWDRTLVLEELFAEADYACEEGVEHATTAKATLVALQKAFEATERPRKAPTTKDVQCYSSRT